MEDDWWPDVMRYLPDEDPWSEELVTVAQMAGYDDPSHPGQRILWSALISTEDLAALNGELRGFSHEVESTGRPGPGAAGQLTPRFYVAAYVGERRIECEPLVLGWISNNRTAMVLDPRFAMTYGLMPRALGDGTIHWDDPAAPEFDVAVVDPPSVYEDLRVSGARARVSRDHLQDYLTLRGMHLVQVYYENRRAGRDDAIERALGGEERRVENLRDREIDIYRIREGGYGAQVWGARVIAGPGSMPITVDDLDVIGLKWPGIGEPVTRRMAGKRLPRDWVYVKDTVLSAYEGQSSFRVHPESGGVAFGGQWSVGHADRVGRDVIRLEIKKLYEGAPDRVIRHWHAHAVAPSPELEGAAALNVRNIAVRAKELTYGIVALGERLSALTSALNLPDRTSKELVGLDREFLDYNGWWTEPFVDPVARHSRIGMARDEFLGRCLDLDKLAIESIAERHLRAIVRAVGAPEDNIDGMRGLKLLDRLTCLAQVGNAAGLSLARAGSEIISRYNRDGTTPPRPLNRLFALSDLRQLKGHRKPETDAGVTKALERFSLDVGAAARGWGLILDAVYDRIVEELRSVEETFTQALSIIAES